ncbi:ALG11 isoform 4 [Pongo abelii]|uniref:ALG11 isoform 4 n=1 Tax=Pongo abelii TaxID=9601 RepID=A0A2J8VS32_PONAB|nr:ALG11 isoform 4 [Pongo abelii]
MAAGERSWCLCKLLSFEYVFISSVKMNLVQ